MIELKKLVSAVLVMSIALTSLPLCAVNGSAVSVEPGDKENGLAIEVNPSKSEYAYGDTAELTVKVTNGYGFNIDNLMISVYSPDCKLPKGEKCKSDIVKLDSGKSQVFTVKAKLGSSAKLNFFQKIVFFFKNLFSRDSSFERISENDKSIVSIRRENGIFEDKTQKSVKFGTADCSFEVTVIYDCGFTEEMLKKWEEDEQITGTQFDESEQIYWYEYDLDGGGTAIGGISLPAEADEEPEELADEQIEGNNPAFLMLDGFSSGVSFNDDSNSYKSLTDTFEKYYGAGHITARYDNFRKTSGSSFMCVSCHGGVYLKDTVNKPYIQLSNYPENEEEFIGDLREKNAAVLTRVYKVLKGETYDYIAKTYGILFPGFFENKTYDNTVVFLESCCAFGCGSQNNKLAEALINSGCKAVIGFWNEVRSAYSKEFMTDFVKRFAMGDDISAAFEYCTGKHGLTDGDEATALYSGDGSATMLECGPKGGNQAGIRLKFHYDDEAENEDSYLFLVKPGKEIVQNDVISLAESVGNADYTYTVDETFEQYAAINGEIKDINIDVSKN